MKFGETGELNKLTLDLSPVAMPPVEAIRSHVNSVLASPPFHSSARCRQFLEFVCARRLAGDNDALKERTIAIEVFGRRPQSDLAEDTIVRVSARELRKRLNLYYATPDGIASDIRIEMPIGSYTPRFSWVPVETEPVPVIPALAGIGPVSYGVMRRNRIRENWVLILAVVGALLSAVVATQFALKTRASAPSLPPLFTQFWQPVFSSDSPLLVAVAHPLVYHPSQRADKLNEEVLGPMSVPGQRALKVDPARLNGNDLVPVFDQYVGFGDMVGVTQISSMLARRLKDIVVRMASTVRYEDFHHGQTLLIGATTNRWAMELQKKWRFQFVRTSEPRTVIIDVGEDGKRWNIQSPADGSASEDFLLVSRILKSETGGILFAAAGLKQFGTEAAGRLMADPEQLEAVLHELPAGWESRNLQIVLHARVIGNAPAHPEVVAWHVW